MNLMEIRIQNFRSFKDETIPLDDYTCLVGPNGSGKSTVLMALNVFFRNNDLTVTDVVNLTKEDFHHENVQEPVRITLTFEDLPSEDDPSITKEAMELLKLYARHDKLVLFAMAEWDANSEKATVKQYGSRLVMEKFSPFIAAYNGGAKVAELKSMYIEIRKEFPQLPAPGTKAAMKSALQDYENKRPQLCTMKDEVCECYGFTGGLYRLADLVQWVYVPAVKDASSEQEEGSKTALGQLLQRTVRTKIDFRGELDALEKEANAQYDKILEGKKDALKDLALAIEISLKEWTNPRATFQLEWQGNFTNAKPPIAKAKVGEDAFIGEIARLGHGMQRGFLVAILKELVASEQKGGPKLLLGFEEPELYQHPPQAQYIQSVLERLVREENNSQVIVTTHSPYFVSSKGFENIRKFRKCGKRPHSVVKWTDYTKVKKRLTEAFGEETQSPTSLMATVGQIMQTSQKELFFSPVVVLVEGEEDVAFIATHLNFTGEWKTFRQNECHFVVAGGKNNMPRLVAITQEFEIPIFVVCDSDIESSNNRLERIKDLQDGQSNKAEKSTNTEQELNKQKKLNKAIVNLCDPKITIPSKCETIKERNIVMWRDKISTEVTRSFGEEDWNKAQDAAKRTYELEGVSKKNGMVIAATLEELDKNGKQSSVLIDLCGRISRYAQEVRVGDRI